MCQRPCRPTRRNSAQGIATLNRGLQISVFSRDMLTIFGFIAVSIMMLSYSFESRSRWLVLVFAGASAATSLYSGLAGIYPITAVEAIWSVIALQRFIQRNRAETVRPEIAA